MCDEAISHINTGDAYLALGNPDKALDSYHKALESRALLEIADEKNLGRKDDTASCYLNIGDSYMTKQDFNNARLFDPSVAN